MMTTHYSGSLPPVDVMVMPASLRYATVVRDAPTIVAALDAVFPFDESDVKNAYASIDGGKTWGFWQRTCGWQSDGWNCEAAPKEMDFARTA